MIGSLQSRNDDGGPAPHPPHVTGAPYGSLHSSAFIYVTKWNQSTSVCDSCLTRHLSGPLFKLRQVIEIAGESTEPGQSRCAACATGSAAHSGDRRDQQDPTRDDISDSDAGKEHGANGGTTGWASEERAEL
ncbi:hypothetical protein Pme01_21400 [Planosporangium mesophilum]|uniref:Uncharacterized protein n=1 Tax=Planosporangium mesophilum TaxID=689768 RepID=A0A8J3T985_9ACTN|nr:hypothetical protein Pme01_21400 [Planosporangium mesophilum]